MRPDDLVFNYWVNNYLLGDSPPGIPTSWREHDSTNLPARLHGEFIDIFKNNTLCYPGQLTALGSPLDLGRIKIPTFVMAGLADHLRPGRAATGRPSCFGGPTTFVLSNAGHIASLVNPPGNPKASYFAGGKPAPTRMPGSAPPRSARERGGGMGGLGLSGIRAASVLPRSSRAARSTRRWIRPRAVM